MIKGHLVTIALSSLMAVSSQAQQVAQKSKLSPLHFEAERNGLKVLPQRFEYTLLDDYKIKIGDVLVDTENIKFSVAPAKNSQGYDLTFTWPIHLFERGELALKNNTGKAILNATFESKDLKLITANNKNTTQTNPENTQEPQENQESESQEVHTEGEQLRSELAAFTVHDVPKATVEDMKYLPYMSFCVMKQSYETKLYLCSNELFLSSEKGQLAVKSRSPRRTQSQIEINSKAVGEQGMIYLNDRNENISFRTLSKYGSTVEIDTRMKEVDFKDVISSDDEKYFILTAAGAEPVTEKNIKREKDGTWKGKISTQRPLLYLKGDGEIPMRQEFYITKSLPKNSQRVFISARTDSKTYGNSLLISGIAPMSVKISKDREDKSSSIQVNEKNQFKWLIEDLATGRQERRFVEVKQGEDVFYAGYDIFRGYPVMLSLSALSLPSSKITSADVKAQWWLENFLGLSSDTFKFHWGLELDYSTAISKPTLLDTYQKISGHILWRAHEGLHLIDPSWGLRAGFTQWTLNSDSLLTPEFGAFYNQKFEGFWNRYLDWYDLSLSYQLGGKSGDTELGSGILAKGLVYKRLSSQWLAQGGLSMQMLDWKDNDSLEKTDLGVELGVSFQF